MSTRLAGAGDARDAADAPPHARRLDGLPHDVDQAGRLEREVGPEPARLLEHPVDHVLAAGPGVGRAVLPGELQPLLRRVHADDPLGALEPAAGHRAEADHPRAEDDAGAARLDLRAVHRRPEAGRQAAGEEAGRLERRVGRDLRERDLRHHRRLGERRAAHEVPELCAVPRQARRAIRQIAGVLLLADRDADVRLARAAVDALAALR